MWPITIKHYDTVTSTNDVAAQLARAGAATATVVVADMQSAGRGRLHRVWESPAGGLWFSLLLQKVQVREFNFFTLTAALAVCETLDEILTTRPMIRWPNDVWIADKKLGGILSEIVDTPTGQAGILGIGLNVNNDSRPIAATTGAAVTSVKNETGRDTDRAGLLNRILEKLHDYYQRVCRGEHRTILEQLLARHLLEGKAVTVMAGAQRVTGVCRGLNDDGALLIDDHGRLTPIYAGDVTLLSSN